MLPRRLGPQIRKPFLPAPRALLDRDLATVNIKAARSLEGDSELAWPRFLPRAARAEPGWITRAANLPRCSSLIVQIAASGLTGHDLAPSFPRSSREAPEKP